MIRAAIVGTGRWGQTLVAGVQGKSSKLRFTHAVSRDPARAGDFARAHDLAVLGSLDAALRLPEIDAGECGNAVVEEHEGQMEVAVADGKTRVATRWPLHAR